VGNVGKKVVGAENLKLLRNFIADVAVVGDETIEFWGGTVRAVEIVLGPEFRDYSRAGNRFCRQRQVRWSWTDL
jgi:hypothetical protein